MWRCTGYLKVGICLGFLAAPITQADSTRAECGFAATVDAPRDVTSACTFSQRQGFITIYIDGGPEFDFRPTADAPGNYFDAEGQAVYRRSGLGKQGLIFQLPDRFLFVYWTADSLTCARDSMASDQGCEINYGGLVFRVRATDAGSINQLTIQAAGLDNGAQVFAHEIDGTAYTAEVADLDANGWPEIYVYVSSAGSGSYGSLVAYAVNTGKSITPIYLRPLTKHPAVSVGYMGHDNFATVENRLVQRFPVYREGDTNSEPTGGMRQLQYRLVAGEAGWQLEVDKVVEY
ncbi:MAG: hypothetical protein WBM41_10220 [Arenicellales bacterium]